jgi:hypothetical protein
MRGVVSGGGIKHTPESFSGIACRLVFYFYLGQSDSQSDTHHLIVLDEIEHKFVFQWRVLIVLFYIDVQLMVRKDKMNLTKMEGILSQIDKEKWNTLWTSKWN